MPIDCEHAFGDGRVHSRAQTNVLARFFPWRAAAHAAKAWARFERFSQISRDCRLGPRAWCVNHSGDRSRIILGARVVCRGLLRVENFGAGRIEIGADGYVGDDCLLSSSHEIVIGEHVLIAHGVQIFDNDSHPLDPAARAADFSAVLSQNGRGRIADAPVRIGARAWIGFNAIILKGVTIGEGSVVAAGSVVVQDVPAGAVVAGNPARVVKTLANVSA